MINKVFTPNDKILDMSWDKLYYQVENETLVLIILTGLYENNKISREKLIGQLNSLKKGTLLKYKHTYHCSINDKWYNGEPAMKVFKDLFSFKNISYIKLLEVLQLYTGKNYNYCVNMIVNDIIKPILNYFSNSSYDYYKQLFNTNLENFPKIEKKGYKTECYECGSTHFISDSRQTEEQINGIIDFFHFYKKGTLTKIPKTL